MKNILLISGLIILIILSSCQSSDQNFNLLSELQNSEKYSAESSAEYSDESADYEMEEMDDSGGMQKSENIGSGTDPDPAGDISSVKIPDKIIKNASMSVEVDNYEDAIKKIKSDIKKWGAYTSNENENGYGYMISNTLTIRVGSDNFESLINDLTQGVKKVESKTISAVDVSEEFVDIIARLKTKKEVENRYIELLKRANTIQDILYIEDKIRVIREEIEAKEGRLKYLQDRVSYSTITIEIKQLFESDKNDPGFGEDMGDAFGGGWSGFLVLLVGLTYLWPLWLIIGIGLFILLRVLKRNKRKQK